MGYLMVDDRASGGHLREYQTVSCCHCQAVIRVVKRQREGFWCTNCMKPVCPRPECTKRCVPFFKKLDRYFAKAALWKALGIDGKPKPEL